MHKEIEKVVLKMTQVMEKNRIAYNEARGNFNDTGHSCYYKKMERLDEEYEELKSFLHQKDEREEEARIEAIKEREELKHLLKQIKAKWGYIKCDLPISSDTIGMDDLLRDI